jgi:hypothetical protein
VSPLTQIFKDCTNYLLLSDDSGKKPQPVINLLDAYRDIQKENNAWRQVFPYSI